MSKNINPEIVRQRQALKLFCTLLRSSHKQLISEVQKAEAKEEEKHKKDEITADILAANCNAIEENQKPYLNLISTMLIALEQCISEFRKIDDSSSTKFAKEIECLNKTYILLFQRPNDPAYAAEYQTFANNLEKSFKRKKNLCTAMKWLCVLVFVLSAVAVISTNPFVLASAVGVAIASLLFFVGFVVLEKKYSNQMTIPSFMSGLAPSRIGFFYTDSDDRERDKLLDSIKNYYQEHPLETPPGELHDDLKQFFPQPIQ